MGRKRRHSDEQIIHELRDAEIDLAQGGTTKDVFKQIFAQELAKLAPPRLSTA